MEKFIGQSFLQFTECFPDNLLYMNIYLILSGVTDINAKSADIPILVKERKMNIPVHFANTEKAQR